ATATGATATDATATAAGPSPTKATDFQVTTAVAVVVARCGRLPVGADEAVAEAGGVALVVGDGAKEAATALPAAVTVHWCDTGVGLRPGALSSSLAAVLADAPLVVLPASADGRDLAPRLAAWLGRPLLAGAVSVGWDAAADEVSAQLSRLEGTLLVGATAVAPAVATLLPGVRTVPVPVGEPVGLVRSRTARTAAAARSSTIASTGPAGPWRSSHSTVGPSRTSGAPSQAGSGGK
nr:hypothetical protein [Micromonospora sp. DSM 115978]